MGESSKKLFSKIQMLMSSNKRSLIPKDWVYSFEKSVLSFQGKGEDGGPPTERTSTLPPMIGAVKTAEEILGVSTEDPKPGMETLVDSVKSKLASYKSTNEIPKWKTRLPMVPVDSINSRTRHVLSSILTAESISSRLKRLDDFTHHLMKYPEAQAFAVKNGAIASLLTLRKSVTDEPTIQALRVAFALLGHVDPPGSTGVRVLTIDGGGIRGIAVIRMLQTLESLTGRPIHQMFDYICGVSTGAIITCCAIPPVGMSMESVYNMYRELSANVFNQSTLWGTSKLVWSHAYYETKLWEEILKSHVGEMPLLATARGENAPKVSTIATIVNQLKCTPFLFRNYAVPYLRKSDYNGSCKNTLFDAVRASAAAPTIFEEYKLGELLLQDGGIFANNPTALAIHEVKALWPNEPISCVVSCGTGQYNPVQTLSDSEESSNKSSTSWKRMFDQILDSATNTEAVHTMLSDLLPENVYFRFNPHLTEYVKMDEIREEKLKSLEDDVNMYTRRNYDKFKFVANKLVQPRSVPQKCTDHVKLKIKLMGYR